MEPAAHAELLQNLALHAKEWRQQALAALRKQADEDAGGNEDA